jgi:hypothetical protein
MGLANAVPANPAAKAVAAANILRLIMEILLLVDAAAGARTILARIAATILLTQPRCCRMHPDGSIRAAGA